jgi:TonB family protein
MQSVSQKIRTGLLELRTPSGLLYANPTFSQRVYLLWIFRHFRSLSRRVLNRRQQELIDKLSETAVVLERGKAVRASIIGAVDNVGNIAIRTRPLAVAAADNVLQMAAASARLSVASAVGSEVAPLPQKRVENNIRPMPEPQPKARVTQIPARTREAPKQEEPRRRVEWTSTSLRLPARKWLEWATGAALGAALLGVVFYVTEMRPSSMSTGSRAGVSNQTTSQPAPVALPLSPPIASAPAKIYAPAISEPGRAIAATIPQPDASRTVRSRVIEPSTVAEESTSIPLVHVAGEPAHNFIYPESPNSGLTGTVNLRALIGADGVVRHVDVLSGKSALARPAIDAIRHWRYRPPQLDGQPAEAETRVTVNFVGDDAVSIIFPEAHN